MSSAREPRRFGTLQRPGGDAHRFDPTLIREYDIRGVVGETLGVGDARAVGRAFGEMLWPSGRRVVVGLDGRHSSPILEAAAVEGLLAAGMEIERIGVGPTPML